MAVQSKSPHIFFAIVNVSKNDYESFPKFSQNNKGT